MSLRVWLPLDGTLENKGVSNVTITAQSGVTVQTNGKIGSCYTSDGSTNGTANNFDITLSHFTIATWLRINTRVNGWKCPFKLFNNSSAAVRQYIGIGCENTNGTSIGFHFYKKIGDTNTKIFDKYITPPATGTWMHLAVTYNGLIARYYLNGIEVTTETIATAVQNTNAEIKTLAMFGANGDYAVSTTKTSLNDVRIYDHCLSAAEVRKISQGLVLHYKLDTLDIQSGTNLVTGVTAGGRTTVLTDGRVGVQTTGVNQDTYFTINLSENIVAGTNYLFTCDASGISNGQYWGFPLGAQGNSGVLPFKIYNGHNVYPFTANSTKSDGTAMDWGTKRLFMDDNYRGDWANQACFYNFQLIKIGASDTVIKVEDSSGYNHNGTIVNTLSLVNSQARYTSNIHFSANNQHIQLPAITYSNFGNSFAIAWWGKRSTHSGMMFWGFSDGNRLNGMYNGTLWNTGDGSNNPIYKPGTTTTITAPTATSWHHYVMVGNGTKSQLYVDGILYGEAKTYKGLTGTSIWINGWRNHTEYSSADMDISDFRIYCTALDAAAVKQLYELGAKVDNKGNIHGYEFIDNQPIKITKQGQVKALEVTEFPDLFKYDLEVYTEADGTKWAHIFHHNAPASNKFASTDTFTTSVYKNANMWFNFSCCNYMTTYEFLSVSKRTASDTPFRCRWIQSKPPLTITFEESKVANITRITSGYDTCSYGGLYHVSGSSWLAANNGTNNNWFGATGCWTAWNNGIPGWRSNASGDAIKDGSIDIYVRIDNMNLHAKATNTNTWQANQLIEI